MKEICKKTNRLDQAMDALEKNASRLHEELALFRESETIYATLFNRSANPLIVADAETGRIENANPAALELFACSKEDFFKKKLSDICENRQAAVSKIFAAAGESSPKSKRMTIRFRAATGKIFPGALAAARLLLQGRMKVFITIQDISDQIQTEEQLRKSRDQLFQSQKMEALGTLVAGVAHEINNPINLIMYNIPLIQRIWQDFKPMFEVGEERFRHKKFGGLPYPFIRENLDQLIADMDLAAKRVETIVRRLKDFARKSSILEKTEISVNDAVQNALRLARSTLKKSKVTIETDLADDLPLIKGHLQSIEQVVLNLVINAYEAISHNQGKIRISSWFAEKEKNVVLLVEDNGCGMQPEIREKIFDPFFTEKQAQGGTGLGLSVSYSLIKSHEGDITCQSTPEKGSAFEIRLPLEPEKRLIRVLIADDDPALRKLLSGALTRSRDFMVETATNGTEALIRLGTWMPDLLILDLFMPQMNGLEVCRTIIREQKLSKMKVVIITGMPGSPEIEEIKKIGYVHVFEKPLKIKQFINDISRLFQ